MASNNKHYWQEQAREIATALLRDPKITVYDDLPQSEVIILKGGEQETREGLVELIKTELVTRGKKLGRQVLFSEEIQFTPQHRNYLKASTDFRTPGVYTFVMDPEKSVKQEDRTYSVDVDFLEGMVSQKEVVKQ